MEESSQNKNNEENKEPNLRTIRTYKGDVADLVKDRKVSTAKIVMAEQKRRLNQQASGEEAETEEPTKKGVFFKIIVSIILFALGGGAIWAAINFGIIPENITKNIPGFKQEEKTVASSETIRILANNKTNIEIENEILRKLSQINTDELDKIIDFKINFVQDTEDGEIERSITTTNFLNILNANVNSRLSRSLSDEFVYAVYTEAEPTPFIILKTNDINITFAEILDWESFMYNDLKKFLKLKDEVPEFITIQQPVATSTETSTQNQQATSTATTTAITIENEEPGFNKNEFTDIVLSNRDVRAIVDEEGEIILMYSFIDDENILFTKDRIVFQQVIKRISNQQLLR